MSSLSGKESLLATEMAAQWQASQRQRLTAYHAFAQLFADKQALRPGLSVQQAADIIFALAGLEVFFLLTAERGWTPAQWEAWITATLADTILR